MECTEFINKLTQLPSRIERESLFHLGNIYFVKTKNIVDFLVVTYKLLPEDLRDARKKRKLTQYQSFKFFDSIDKMFMGKSLLNNCGLAIIKKQKIQNIVTIVCNVLPNDENKMLALRQQ